MIELEQTTRVQVWCYRNTCGSLTGRTRNSKLLRVLNSKSFFQTPTGISITAYRNTDNVHIFLKYYSKFVKPVCEQGVICWRI